MGSTATELNSSAIKSFLIEKKFFGIEFLTELASIDRGLRRKLRIIEYIEDYLKELIKEQQKFPVLNYEVPFSKLLMKNAIETLKKGITQFKAAINDKRTDFKPNPEQSLSSRKLKPHQQQEASCKPRKSWSPELHVKFVHCLEQLADSEVAQMYIKKLMKLEVLANRKKLESDHKQRKLWSYEQHKKFVSCLPELGGPEVATPNKIKELMEEDELTTEDVNTHLKLYCAHIRKRPNARKSSNLSLTSRLQPKQLESDRKQRKIWSHEQHKKFVNCLSELGGSEVATPKRIKELMQEDELTTEDVNTHLKMYHEHIQKTLNARTSSNLSLSPKSLLQSQLNIGSEAKMVEDKVEDAKAADE